ncbi:hypothetical protein ACN47E_003522 [Coniothyrium glycines]
MGIANAVCVSLSFLSGLWIPATLLCCIPWVQKQMLYLHNITFFPGKRLDEPERAGFLKNQITPFRISTEDGEQLFAWLIAPLGVYAKHANELIHEVLHGNDIEDRLAFKLLRSNPESRLLLYFHGNSATIAQERRCEEYRSYSAGASDTLFVLAFDYRGFGKSTGDPSEQGLMRDAKAIVEWAVNTAGIPPERIVLLGHSLGTAVVSGVAHHFAQHDFAGIILCAAFTNAGNAFACYSIGGVVPVLAPLRMFSGFQAWFSARMVDSWCSDIRLAEMARTRCRLNLVLVHAEDDTTMPWHETEALFVSTVEAARAVNLHSQDTGHKEPQMVDLGEAGWQEIWQSNAVRVSKTIAKHGGHNTSMKWSPVALTILQVLGVGSAAPQHTCSATV